MSFMSQRRKRELVNNDMNKNNKNFNKKSPKPHSKNSIKRRVKENAIIMASKAKELGLTMKEVADKINNGEIKLR